MQIILISELTSPPITGSITVSRFFSESLPRGPLSKVLAFLAPTECVNIQAVWSSNYIQTGLLCYNEAERLSRLMDQAVPSRNHMSVCGLTLPFDIPDVPEKDAVGADYLVWQEVNVFKARVGALALKKLHDLLPPKSTTVTSVELQLKAYKVEQELSLMHFTKALNDEHLINLLATINAGRAPEGRLGLDALKTALGADIPAYITEIRAWFQNPDSSIRTAEELHLHDKGLKSIPPEIGGLVGLQMFTVMQNQISEIPPEIGELVRLECLVFSGNQISIIPPEIARLEGLQEFYLDDNQIEEIPSLIGRLVGLHQLFLGHNQIKGVPLEIRKLVGLQELRLSNNLLDPDIVIPVRAGCKVFR